MLTAQNASHPSLFQPGIKAIKLQLRINGRVFHVVTKNSLQILHQILLDSTHARPNLWMGQDPVNTFKFHWKQREARAFSIQLSWAHSWTQKYLWYGSITLFLAPGTLWIFGQSFVNKPLLIHFFFSDLLEKFKLMIYGRWKLFPLLRQVQVQEHLQLL